MKIVYNSCYGGFGLSSLAKSKCFEYGMNPEDYTRDNPILVKVVEELGPKANGAHAKLQIIDWPDDIPWTINEYDGNESVDIDPSEFENWLQLAEHNDGMKDLIEQCRIFYQLAGNNK